MSKTAVLVDYTDYKGNRSMRKILPVRLAFGVYQDKKPEYVIVAVDLEADQVRTFAIKDIHHWEQLDE